ncbi:hypothetical protein BOX37_30870 [Nocardia mangyaensis]|uniref:Uncharacterized protein n=2 Tax=Nocardia mangyaensis TaxID=2213200 RepID=A0A1J0VZZ6_9NOCA|nr:hypothetical protein BOX37_30870 [Nocardia mangyaensis]
MWFGLAAIALVGAVVLLYFDRVQRQRTGHARQVWAKSQGYTYVSVEPALASTWRRGALAKLGYLSAVDVVSGIRKGEKFVLFDLEDAATLVAVRRQIGSEIDVDMRLKTASPPKDHDLELLGAIGDRVVFATDPEIARHAVDQRMVGFIESLSDTVQMLWSEGNWTLGMLPIGSGPKDWETTIDAVLRLSGLLHVLPPVAEPSEYTRPRSSSDLPPQATGFRAEYEDDDRDGFGATRPSAAEVEERGRARFPGPDELDDFDDEPSPGRRGPADDFDDESMFSRRGPAPATDLDDEPPFGRGPARASAAEPDDYEFDERAPIGRTASYPPDFDPDLDDPEFEDQPAPGRRPLGEPPRRPSLAVVPEPRPRVEPPRPVGAEDDEDSDQPGGPFHPGFRPYQGPVPK